MPRRLAQRTVLPPARDPAKDYCFVKVIWPKPQPFHHAGPETFDDDTSAVDQRLRGIVPLFRLQIQKDGPLAAPVDIGFVSWRFGAVDDDHIRAQIGQQLPRQRAGTDPGHFDDFQSFQRSRHN